MPIFSGRECHASGVERGERRGERRGEKQGDDGGGVDNPHTLVAFSKIHTQHTGNDNRKDLLDNGDNLVDSLVDNSDAVVGVRVYDLVVAETEAAAEDNVAQNESEQEGTHEDGGDVCGKGPHYSHLPHSFVHSP